jgi:cytochrome b involved in lipid metabolism
MRSITYKIFILIIAFTLSLACPSQNANDGSNQNPINNLDLPTYTLADLQQARTEGKCWMAINGDVYDITDFIPQHPGGNIINDGCGTDATVFFETRPMGSGTPHSTNARLILERYLIGRLVQ